MTDLIERLQNEADYLRRGPCKSASIALDAAIAEITRLTADVKRLTTKAEVLAKAMQNIKRYLRLADKELPDTGTSSCRGLTRRFLNDIYEIASDALFDVMRAK